MRVILSSLDYSAMSKSGFSKKIKQTPYREAFARLITKRAWYAPLGWKANHAFIIKQRFIAGTLKDETIEKIMKKIEENDNS
jgi:REP element-mobilizing transposase RayT